jgi:glycosyltransferase involved in cell wall biosynthesis
VSTTPPISSLRLETMITRMRGQARRFIRTRGAGWATPLEPSRPQAQTVPDSAREADIRAGRTSHSDRTLLLVTDAWHPQVNGVVVAITKLKQLLEREGFSVLLVHPGLFLTVPLPFYPEIRLSMFSSRMLKYVLLTERPDYVHIATEGPLGLAARNLCARYRLPFTTSFHTHFQLYAFARLSAFLGPAFRYLRWFHRSAQRTMVATAGLKAALEANNFSNLHLWPLGVDTDLFVRNTGPPVAALPKPVFTYFSRLALEKSPEDFLRLSLPGSKLIIGDGPARERLEAKYGDTALFVGYKQGQELVNWLSLSDVVVIPSRTETFGLVILESLACGVPVAAHNVMGPQDIITQGVDGYLDDDLEKAALACLHLSPEACRSKALKYSWEVSAQAFIRNLVATKF